MPFSSIMGAPEARQNGGGEGPVLYSSEAQGPSRYIKGDLIGRGACKTVYRAFDEREGMEVAWNEISINSDALTSLDERARERIFGEIKLLKQLKHKNVLALYDWWYDKKNSNLIFITELLIDGSLRAYRRRHKNVDVSVLKRWGWQILQGLVYLHGHNPPIIHRDLKSDNIFVNGASGTLKIGDLGFATFKAGLSSAMSVIGTPEFMAPELYEEKYDEKVDIYSFGLCLLELATLEYPYSECRNAAQIFKKVTQGIPPQGLARIADPELREFVLLCIRQNPEERPEARMLLKHPFFEAIRENGSRAKLSAASAPAALPTPAGLTHSLVPTAPSGLPSPPGGGTRTPAVPPPAPAGGLAAAAATAAHAAAAIVAAGGERSAAATADAVAVPAAVAAGGALMAQIGSHGANSPLNLGAPPVMATLTAAAAALGRAAATAPEPTVHAPLPAAQLPHANSVTVATLPGAQATIQPLPGTAGGAGALASSGRHSQEDAAAATVSSAAPAMWAGYPMVQWSAHNSLERGSGLQQDMRIAAAALAGSWRSSAGGAVPPAAPSSSHAASSGMVSAYASAQPSLDASNLPLQASHAAAAAAAAAAALAAKSAAAGAAAAASVPAVRHAASGASGGSCMGDINEEVLLYGEEEGEEGQSCRTSMGMEAVAVPAGGSSLAPESSYRGGSAFSPPARLSGQRSMVCPVEDDTGSEAELEEEEDEEEGPPCDSRLGQRVRLMCRNFHDNKLSFSMSFINHNGTRKKVGFQYDMDFDTAAEVAGEMIDNLSLNQAEAGYIASLIQQELSRHQPSSSLQVGPAPAILQPGQQASQQPSQQVAGPGQHPGYVASPLGGAGATQPASQVQAQQPQAQQGPQRTSLPGSGPAQPQPQQWTGATEAGPATGATFRTSGGGAGPSAHPGGAPATSALTQGLQRSSVSQVAAVGHSTQAALPGGPQPHGPPHWQYPTSASYGQPLGLGPAGVPAPAGLPSSGPPGAHAAYVNSHPAQHEGSEAMGEAGEGGGEEDEEEPACFF